MRQGKLSHRTQTCSADSEYWKGVMRHNHPRHYAVVAQANALTASADISRSMMCVTVYAAGPPALLLQR
jgi:hypothetical protein